jgi:hypothetical protein
VTVKTFFFDVLAIFLAILAAQWTYDRFLAVKPA